MWNIYENDLTQVTKETDLSRYTDDHQIFTPDHENGRELQGGNKTVTNWYIENLLQVEVNKYQSMVLSQRNNTYEMNTQIGDVATEQLQSIKLIGGILIQN